MKISKEISEALSPEVLKAFEESVEKMVTDLVAEGVSKGIAEKEVELKKKYDLVAEEYVQKKIAYESAKLKAKLIKENDAKLESLEKKVVSRLGSFVDKMVSENISDALVEKIAINEVALPIVNGMKELLEKNSIKIDPVVEDKSSALTEQIDILKKQLSESLSKNMELDTRLAKSVNLLILSEKTQGLTGSQKKAVVKEFKNSSYEELTEKIDGYVALVKEATDTVNKKIEESKVESRKARIVEGTRIPQTKKTFSRMISESDVITREKKEESPSIFDVANDIISSI